jgi:hypothetical protein
MSHIHVVRPSYQHLNNPQKPLCRPFLVTQLPRLTCSAGTSTETHSVETPTLEKYFPGHGILIFAEAYCHVTLGKGLAWHATFPGNIFLASTARFPGKIVHSLKAMREA